MDKYKHTDSFIQTHPASFISETFTESQLQWRHKQLCTDGQERPIDTERRALGHSGNRKAEPGVLSLDLSLLFLPSLEVNLHQAVKRTSYFLDFLPWKSSSLLWKGFPSLGPLGSSPGDPGVSTSVVQSCPGACCLQRAMFFGLDLPFLEGCKCTALIFLMHGIYEVFFPPWGCTVF